MYMRLPQNTGGTDELGGAASQLIATVQIRISSSVYVKGDDNMSRANRKKGGKKEIRLHKCGQYSWRKE